jgi:hypothetical protein
MFRIMDALSARQQFEFGVQAQDALFQSVNGE